MNEARPSTVCSTRSSRPSGTEGHALADRRHTLRRLLRPLLLATGLVIATAGCAAAEVPESPPTSTTNLPSSLPPTTAETTTTTTEPPVDEAFVADCVDHVLFLAYTGNEGAQTQWNELGQDEAQLENDCRSVERSPSARRSMQDEMAQLAAFFDGGGAPAPTSTTTTQPTTTTSPSTTVALPPKLELSCPSNAREPAESYRLDFGYSIEWTSPIVEWGMDYGDGKSHVANSEASAEQDLYWHTYHSPGRYRAVAWVVDANGSRVENGCTWEWHEPPPVLNVQPVLPQPSPGGSDDCHPSYTPCVPSASDVDCRGGSGNGPAYTGRVQVIGPDVYGLDGDGDGIGCE